VRPEDRRLTGHEVHLGNPIVQVRYEPLSVSERHMPAPGLPEHFSRWGIMEDLFEFMFGASGRINRAKYWRSVLLFSFAGLLPAVILFTAAGIAAPLFIIMVVVVFIPWLLLGGSPSPQSGCMIATRARGGYWCSTGCRRCWASLQKPPGLSE
jgi:hypothetical protein